MEIDPKATIYVMEKWIMNSDYPDSTEIDGDEEIIEPYHNGWFLVAIETEPEKVDSEGEFMDLEKLADFLLPLSNKQKILCERHPFYQEEVDMEGHIEKICGLQYSNAEKLEEKGVIFREGFY